MKKPYGKAVCITGLGAFALLVLAVSAWTGTQPVLAAEDDPLTYEPSLIVSKEAEECSKCHKQSVDAWNLSKHKITFDKLHTRKEATDIVKALGGRSVKRDDECVRCHYTMAAKTKGGALAAVTGVGCQRCHGEAQNWMALHADEVKYPDKTPRLKLAEAQGMRPTYNIHKLASSCFECHTVPREALVNVGGHSAGSDFELVAWSQGEVRHNFLPLPEDGTHKNRAPEPKQLQLLYVMGKVLDLEYSIRALGAATAEGKFLDAMKARVEKAAAGVKGLGLGLPQIKAIIDAVPATLGPNQADAMNAAADKISTQAQALEASKPDLAAVNSQIPTTGFKGKVHKP